MLSASRESLEGRAAFLTGQCMAAGKGGCLPDTQAAAHARGNWALRPAREAIEGVHPETMHEERRGSSHPRVHVGRIPRAHLPARRVDASPPLALDRDPRPRH